MKYKDDVLDMYWTADVPANGRGEEKTQIEIMMSG